MKNVIVVSDIHIPTRSLSIPEKFVEIAKNADMVIGAGDYVKVEVVNKLKEINADFAGVYGNMDENAVKTTLKKYLQIQVEDVKIGIILKFAKRWNFLV